MYKLFGDESGLKNAEQEKVCVVAGFLGSTDQWDDFSAGWKRVLDEFGVQIFHGIDFWDWHLNDKQEVQRKEPYQGWSDEDDFAFMDALLKVIENAKLYKSGSGIAIERFFELTEDERRYLTTSSLYDRHWQSRGKPSDPWFTAFQHTILTAGVFVPDGEKMYPIFDRRNSPLQKKQPEQVKAIELYNEMLDQQPPLKVRPKLGDSLIFGSTGEHFGLQAADLLANRSRVYVADGLGDFPLAERIRKFLEAGNGYVKMLGLRGLDLVLRGCPFRSTFWKTNEFKTAQPDYLESMRGSAKLNVIAYKGTRTGNYYSHHLKPEKIRRVKRVGVSGNLVYIASPDE